MQIQHTAHSHNGMSHHFNSTQLWVVEDFLLALEKPYNLQQGESNPGCCCNWISVSDTTICESVTQTSSQFDLQSYYMAVFCIHMHIYIQIAEVQVL